ncbi:polyprotein [Bienertia sinuspersici]
MVIVCFLKLATSGSQHTITLQSNPNQRKEFAHNNGNPNSALKHTHNQDGVLKDRPTTWTRGESALFDSLGIFGENKRQTTYVATFLSCWLCAFVLPENYSRIIRPGTFEIATLMARGQTFSLTIPVLASIYCGLNIISRSSKPAYSGASFPTHYVYGWLAHYFNTNYVVDPPPAGPLMEQSVSMVKRPVHSFTRALGHRWDALY